MVKSLISILVAIVLLAGVALFEGFYVHDQFQDFGEELTALYKKVDSGTANGEDAKIVQDSWERRKEDLHVWIPHNDISRIDDYMSETVGLISEQNFSLALAKLEILMHLTECLPDTYRAAIENIM